MESSREIIAIAEARLKVVNEEVEYYEDAIEDLLGQIEMVHDEIHSLEEELSCASNSDLIKIREDIDVEVRNLSDLNDRLADLEYSLEDANLEINALNQDIRS